ncbi:MAG: IPT/TIG domain-containing protein, partial [Calditrichaeota bacterium]|nr:IPT/TIG domain-containing protein [Calditrichota bacterium]
MKLFLGSLLVAGLLTLGCEDNNQPILGVDDTDPNPTGGPASSITVLSPTEGFLKDVVVIQGSGFNTTPGYNLVRFGNKVGTVTAATATELTVQTPNLADVTVMVQVAVKGSEVWSNELPFTFKPTL